uniref:hypothetical protein n=1 Tax=Porticoccus hydrocarbonoclasticus TaxID=1073414 RepID=UPI0030ED59D3
MDEHDTSYKLLFSHDRMVWDLLTGFLPREWIAALFRLEHHRSSEEVAALLSRDARPAGGVRDDYQPL